MEIRGSLQPEFVETSSAKEAVLSSNTPSFLLNRLRKDSSTSYVSGKLKTEEIINLLKERCATPPASPLDLLWIYVLLAALSRKDDLNQFKESISSLDLSRIQWGDEIRRAAIEDRTATNFLDVRYSEVRKDGQADISTNVTKGTLLVSGTER
jgi:hypothetical protein